MEWVKLIGASVVAVAVIAGVCFVAYLVFLYLVVKRTGSTEGLKDVAAAIDVYEVPLPTAKRAKNKVRRPPQSDLTELTGETGSTGS